MRSLIAVLIAVVLLACSNPDPRYQIAPQKWNDAVIEIQSRPTPVRPGMNEFLVIATLERGKPVSDLVVSLRAGPGDDWQQAIQDGHSGVYRRALRLPGTPNLYVQLRKNMADEETVLEFPLIYAGDL